MKVYFNGVQVVSFDSERIGNLIKQARKAKKMTQGDLAQKMQLKTPAIYKYEKGLIHFIPYENRIALSIILDIPLNDLLYFFETPFIKENNVGFMEQYFKDKFDEYGIEGGLEDLKEFASFSDLADYREAYPYLLEDTCNTPQKREEFARRLVKSYQTLKDLISNDNINQTQKEDIGFLLQALNYSMYRLLYPYTDKVKLYHLPNSEKK